MRAVIRDFAEILTSATIASSIWLLRKKKRWARWRIAWGQWPQGGQAAAAAATVATPAPVPPPPQRAAVRPSAQRANPPAHAPLDHVEVVEDSDWHLWEAAVSSQNNCDQGRAA